MGMLRSKSSNTRARRRIIRTITKRRIVMSGKGEEEDEEKE